ncbi:MAG: transposase [Aeromonas sp.]
MIGGEGHIVEIDECKFSKRKFHVGREFKSAWVVGGIDVQTRQTFFVEVLRRDTETLKRVIRENVLPNTIIYTDCWAGYNFLDSSEYIHMTVNHKEHFIDPVSGANTQLIENSWSVFKKSLRSRFLNKRSDITAFFAEYLFKRMYKEDVFAAIMQNLYE